jgi:hypothetical protein
MARVYIPSGWRAVIAAARTFTLSGWCGVSAIATLSSQTSTSERSGAVVEAAVATDVEGYR